MLTLVRVEGSSIHLSPSDDIPADMTVAELFANGTIKIMLVEATKGRARIGVEAPKCIDIMREELLEE